MPKRSSKRPQVPISNYTLLRLAAGFEQKELAAKLGLTQSDVSRLERGTKPWPSDLLARFVRLCDPRARARGVVVSIPVLPPA
jgi:predicted transcriptional regulator